MRALITGASSGLGLEFARQLHARGYTVTVLARRTDRLSALVAELNSIRPGSADLLGADLCLPRGEGTELLGLNDVAEWIAAHTIDLLVNNAGRGSFGRAEEINLADEIEIVRLNIEAPLVLSHAVIPQLKTRKSGGIIYVSSIAGFQPLPYLATYSGSKAFDLFHSLALRYELQAFGVNVLAVCPGPTATEFGGVARVPGTPTGVRRDSAEDVVRESIRAYETGKAIVVPCLRPKFLAFISRYLPLPLSSRITARLLRSSLP